MQWKSNDPSVIAVRIYVWVYMHWCKNCYETQIVRIYGLGANIYICISSEILRIYNCTKHLFSTEQIWLILLKGTLMDRLRPTLFSVLLKKEFFCTNFFVLMYLVHCLMYLGLFDQIKSILQLFEEGKSKQIAMHFVKTACPGLQFKVNFVHKRPFMYV